MDWTHFWFLIGGNALATGAIAYFVKVLVEKRFKEQQSRFEHDLAKDRDAIKGILDKRLAAFSHRHSLYCERQADAIGALYAGLCSASTELNTAVLAESAKGTNAQIDAAFKQVLALWDKFDSQRIYFPPALADSIDMILREYMSLGNRYRGLRIELKGDDSFEAFYEYVGKLKKKTKESLVCIEREFRTLLAGENT